MAAIFKSKLQDIFPHWKITRREIIWLWLILRSTKPHPYLGNFGAFNMWEKMADYIVRESLVAEIEKLKSYMLLPEQVFDWFGENERQLAWLQRKAEPMTYDSISTHPLDFTPREHVIALFDCWNIEAERKIKSLNTLKKDWVEVQLQDKQLSWYASAGKETIKCKTAWVWYQKNHRSDTIRTTEFTKLEDVLKFLDGTNFSLDEKLYHLGQIKKRFKALETKANRKGKTQTNVSLSDSTRLQLDELARKERRTKTEIIELLIEIAHAKGMPH